MTDKTLKQFYREIQQWIDDGCPEHDVFKKHWALCRAVLEYGGMDIVNEIKQSFKNSMMDENYPFNGAWPNFTSERYSENTYKNPARLAWIKEHSK